MKYLKLIIVYLLLFTSCVFGQPNEDWPKVNSEKYNKRLNFLLSGSVPFIEVSDLKAKKNVAILDTRAKDEFDISRIPGAIYVGPNFDQQTIELLKLENREIVVYCSVGYRSEKYGEELINAGYKNVYNLYGGIFEWVNLENPLENSDSKNLYKLHTYLSLIHI